MGRGLSREPTVAEAMLRSLRRYGVEYVFANFGTDHTPLLEAAAKVQGRGWGDLVPEFIVCPHEFVALSAAHGYAVATGSPQAVLVHVDVGTQNLGAALHNAHRAQAPVLILAGEAPVSDAGYAGSRDNIVHYKQDVFDQSGIVREYSRWTAEYKPPGDPAAMVARGLERAGAPPAGPTYLSATREALEATDFEVSSRSRPAPRKAVPQASEHDIDHLVDLVSEAERPLTVTSRLGSPPADRSVKALVSFAETAGVGVVETRPMTLSFPRDHPLHLGFDPEPALAAADLVVVADVDVPWLPPIEIPAETTVVQIDSDPTKRLFPKWDFPVDYTVAAEPVDALDRVTERLGYVGEQSPTAEGPSEAWGGQVQDWRTEARAILDSHRESGQLTPEVLSDSLNAVVDESTVVVEDIVTSRPALLDNLHLTKPGSYLSSGGAGLGWAGGAALGLKLASPEKRVVSLLGDGAYVFSQPMATAWVAAAHDAPTLTVIFDNGGWNAVHAATRKAHSEGAAIREELTYREFEPRLDLTAPSQVVDAHASVVKTVDALESELLAAVEAVDAGQPAVLDVKLELP